MLNSLPEALIDSVLSFCEYKDILKVATLNSDCRDRVEAFCGRLLAKFQERHPVDSSWQFRLGMQVNVARERQPATLSNRHMLKCAREMHIYSIGSRECNRTVSNLVFIPDNNTLAMCGYDDTIRVWDLKSQQFVRSFATPDNGQIYSLHFSEGFIISISPIGVFHIFSMEGIFLHSFRDNMGEVNAFTTCGSQAFLATSNENGPDEIVVFDIRSGERILHRQQSWNPFSVIPRREMLAVADWLLVTCEVLDYDLRDDAEAVAQEGIYVLKRSNLVQESRFRGRFRCVESSKDGSYIAAIDSDSGAINILSMDSGTLAHIRTFAVPRPADTPVTEVLLLSGPLLYMARRGFGQRGHARDAIKVFSIENGELVRTLIHPAQDPFTEAFLRPDTLATNGRELFCGFYVLDGRSMSIIKAYPL